MEQMSPELHDLLHALARLEKYYDEQRRYIDIVNKIINDMILNKNENTDTNHK
jgi:hypothetical protein